VTFEAVGIRGRLDGRLRYRRPGPDGWRRGLLRSRWKPQRERPDSDSCDDNAASAHDGPCRSV